MFVEEVHGGVLGNCLRYCARLLRSNLRRMTTCLAASSLTFKDSFERLCASKLSVVGQAR